MQEYRKYSGNGRYKGAVARNGRRRNLFNLYITIAAAIIAALAALLSVNVFFNISPGNLQISGSTLYADEQIKAVGGIVEGQNLVRLNTTFVAARLKDNLVYIDDVKVMKKYPNGLVIDITEATEKAQIEYEGGYYTVSSSGRLLEVNQSQRNESLPLVKGFELKSPVIGQDAESEDEHKAEILKLIFDNLQSSGFDSINEIDISDRTDITLIYDGRIELQLGSTVDLELKFKSLKSVIDSGLPDSYEGILRYNGADSGISAIPKQEEVPSAPVSASGVDSLSQDSTADYNNGYTDSYSDYNNGYTDSTTDYNYGYTDSYSYYDNGDNGYTDNYYGDGGNYTDYTDGNGYDYNYNYDYNYGY